MRFVDQTSGLRTTYRPLKENYVRNDMSKIFEENDIEGLLLVRPMRSIQ